MMPEQRLLLPPRKAKTALLKYKLILWFEKSTNSDIPRTPVSSPGHSNPLMALPILSETLALRNRVSLVQTVP